MIQIAPPDWLAEVQWPPKAVPRTATRPAPLLFDPEHRPITTVAAWVRRRTELRQAWQAFLGAIPGPRPANRLEVVDEDRPYLPDICPTASFELKKRGRTACFGRLIRTICCPAARHMSGSSGQESAAHGPSSVVLSEESR